MKFIISADTDIGISKNTNQDSICVQYAQTKLGHAVMALVCDGMGGLSKGELASATVVKAFKQWFVTEFPGVLRKSPEGLDWKQLSQRWEQIIKALNQKILEYAKDNHVEMGTTFTGILIVKDEYMIVHVGDSRVYRINSSLTQLTEDHTVVNREVQRGRISKAEAEDDPRRNVLLQCVGASATVTPDILFGTVGGACNYMLCSDGFRHEISEDEIYNELNPRISNDKEAMTRNLRGLIETVKLRHERDNVSAILIGARE
jgi:serine/threonine protein phosphatase PrpC